MLAFDLVSPRTVTRCRTGCQRVAMQMAVITAKPDIMARKTIAGCPGVSEDRV